jgi:hypothetical protein
MQHLEASDTPVLYIERTVLKYYYWFAAVLFITELLITHNC